MLRKIYSRPSISLFNIKIELNVFRVLQYRRRKWRGCKPIVVWQSCMRENGVQWLHDAREVGSVARLVVPALTHDNVHRLRTTVGIVHSVAPFNMLPYVVHGLEGEKGQRRKVGKSGEKKGKGEKGQGYNTELRNSHWFVSRTTLG